MKKIVSGSDAIINLELKDRNGYIIPLFDDNLVKYIDIYIYTKGTKEFNYIYRGKTSQLAENHIKIQSEELGQLERGQIFIDISIAFFCNEFEDEKFGYRNKIATNIILV